MAVDHTSAFCQASLTWNRGASFAPVRTVPKIAAARPPLPQLGSSHALRISGVICEGLTASDYRSLLSDRTVQVVNACRHLGRFDRDNRKGCAFATAFLGFEMARIHVKPFADRLNLGFMRMAHQQNIRGILPAPEVFLRMGGRYSNTSEILDDSLWNTTVAVLRTPQTRDLANIVGETQLFCIGIVIAQMEDDLNIESGDHKAGNTVHHYAVPVRITHYAENHAWRRSLGLRI